MPFRLTDTFPQGDPDVQVFFHGLLMLCPNDDGSECDVGVHRLAVEHRLSVSVREKASEAPDPPLLRLVGPLDSLGLSIQIDPPTGDGVRQFVPTAAPFDRSANNNDPKDFRWSVDLDQLDPAGPQVKLKQSAVSPRVKIKDGLFHTARLTKPEILKVELKQPGQSIDLHRVAHLLGANIYLTPGQVVKLTWFGDGQIQELRLPKSDEGRTFVVYVDNSPSLMPIGKPTHNEFVEYYKAVETPPRKYDLDFTPGPGFHGTDAAPCMPVVVGGGGKG